MKNFTQRYYLFFHKVHVHPLWFALLGIILGIVFCWINSWLLCIGSVIICSIALFETNQKLRYFCVGIVMGVCSYAFSSYTYEQQSALLMQARSHILMGRIKHIAIQDDDRPYRVTLHVALQSITAKGKFHPINGLVWIYLSSVPDLCVGDIIHLGPCKAADCAQDSLRSYLRKESVLATYFTKAQPRLISRPYWSLERYIQQWREQISVQLHTHLSDQYAHLFSLIFLGHKESDTQFSQQVRMQYEQWGIAHYLARSGLHLVILALLLHFFIGLLPLSERIKIVLGMGFMLLYTLLTWMSISFIRAIITWLLYQGAYLARYQPHALHVLVLVSCGVLMYNPFYLFALDFQLSFGLTAAIAWLMHNQRTQSAPSS